MRQIVCNGKLVEVPDNATVGDLPSLVGGIAGDQFIQVQGSRTKRLSDDAPIPGDGELVSVPPIVKG